MKSINSNGVKNINDVLQVISKQLDCMDPDNKPSDSQIHGARATSALVNSYIGTLRVSIQYAKMRGTKASLGVFGIEDEPKKKAIAA